MGRHKNRNGAEALITYLKTISLSLKSHAGRPPNSHSAQIYGPALTITYNLLLAAWNINLWLYVNSHIILSCRGIKCGKCRHFWLEKAPLNYFEDLAYPPFPPRTVIPVRFCRSFWKISDSNDMNDMNERERQPKGRVDIMEYMFSLFCKEVSKQPLGLTQS